MLVRRRNRPIGVMRGSSLILNAGPSCSFSASSCRLRASASATIERNFSIQNSLPPRPLRFWRKKIGPGEVSLIATATNANNGASNSKPERCARHVDQPASTPAAGGRTAVPSPGPAARRVGSLLVVFGVGCPSSVGPVGRIAVDGAIRQGQARPERTRTRRQSRSTPPRPAWREGQRRSAARPAVRRHRSIAAAARRIRARVRLNVSRSAWVFADLRTAINEKTSPERSLRARSRRRIRSSCSRDPASARPTRRNAGQAGARRERVW